MRGHPMTFEKATTFPSLGSTAQQPTPMRFKGLNQSDLEAIIIVGRRLDLDVDIDATHHGELFALVRGPEATFCISGNAGVYHMSNGNGHVVAEADSIGEILAALS